MEIERKIGIGILVFVFIIFCLVTVPIMANVVKTYVVAILPEKTDKPKLIRVYDSETGVICYMIQNDTANFYSGLQCIHINKTDLYRKGKGLW